jgi:hypothetical protein
LSQGSPFEDSKASSTAEQGTGAVTQDDDDDDNQTLSSWGSFVLFSFIGVPALCAIAYGFKQLINPKIQKTPTVTPSNNAKTTLVTKFQSYLETNGIPLKALIPITFGICVLIVTALIILSLYSYFVGGSLLLMIFLFVYSSGVYWVWFRNRYYLPFIKRQSLWLAFVVIIVSSTLM